jgi:hypothetical protein
MIHPWYRSRLFWLGLPGLLFLLWTWLGCSIAGWVGWMTDDYFPIVGHYDGSISVEWMEDLGMGFEFGDKGLRWDYVPNGERGLWSPAAQFQRKEEPGTQRRTRLMIADWTMVLAYLSAWWLIYRWWQRRKARLLKVSTAPRS